MLVVAVVVVMVVVVLVVVVVVVVVDIFSRPIRTCCTHVMLQVVMSTLTWRSWSTFRPVSA